jgi:hypothetical protein
VDGTGSGSCPVAELCKVYKKSAVSDSVVY